MLLLSLVKGQLLISFMALVAVVSSIEWFSIVEYKLCGL